MPSFRWLELLNVWSTQRVVECRFPAEFLDLRVDAERLLQPWKALRCPPDRVGAAARVARALRGPGTLVHAIRAVASELQRQSSGFCGRSWLQDDSRGPREEQSGVAIGLECVEFEFARLCLLAAERLVLCAERGEPCSLEDAIVRLVDQAEECGLFECHRYLAREASRRDLPWNRLGGTAAVLLGEGRHRRFATLSLAASTSHLAAQIASDKLLVKQIWSQVGLPVPPGREVRSAEEAILAASELGMPVVVKPCDADYGNGVSLRLQTAEQVRNAYVLARAESERVLIERHLEGSLHRLLVIGGQLTSAIRREPASVLGNGVQTIAELIEQENARPQRGPDERWPLLQLKLRDRELATLADQGLHPSSVPALGQQVFLRHDARISGGGATVDVTALVHDDTAVAAIEAVRAIGLDIAGVDLIATDIRRPLAEQGGAFLEINEQPAIYIHMPPFCSTGRRVARSIVGVQFPKGTPTRVPTTLVVGGAIADAVCESLRQSWPLSLTGTDAWGVSTIESTTIGPHRLNPLTATPSGRLRSMMLDHRTRRAVLSATPGGLCRYGLGTDRLRTLVLLEGPGTSIETGEEPDSAILRWATRTALRARWTIIDPSVCDWSFPKSLPARRTIMLGGQPDDRLTREQVGAGGLWAQILCDRLTLQADERVIANWTLTGPATRRRIEALTRLIVWANSSALRLRRAVRHDPQGSSLGTLTLSVP